MNPISSPLSWPARELYGKTGEGERSNNQIIHLVPVHIVIPDGEGDDGDDADGGLMDLCAP